MNALSSQAGWSLSSAAFSGSVLVMDAAGTFSTTPTQAACQKAVAAGDTVQAQVNVVLDHFNDDGNGPQDIWLVIMLDGVPLGTTHLVQASITPRKEGFMTLEISGNQENCLQAIEYLRGQSITVTDPAQRISRNEDSCMHCGMCLAVCPRGSLYINREEHTVGFNIELCTACGLCTKICPVNAMTVELENGSL